MAEAIADLAPRFPHQKEYLAQLITDLDGWVEGGCGKPDFKDSLALFRPDLERRDGVEHLVVFPMYTPNGSPDTRFEALIVRTPWPQFVAQIERELYDDPKFVPVQLVANTAGYDSECAVLFPETVSVAERPTNHFGAIFCDRESARYRRTTLWGAEVLDIDLPPDARALASSPDLALETYILWDMIHDRWHSHGDLPFDPFMIRQRLPYWMYSPEELAVFASLRMARPTSWRRRSPSRATSSTRSSSTACCASPSPATACATTTGWAGSCSSATCTRTAWCGGPTTGFSWIGGGSTPPSVSCAVLIEQLYRHGIETSKVTYWIAAHDLISLYVTPNIGSQWRKEARVYSDESEPRAWIDRVLDDEFPLNMFYESLKKKVAQ